MNRWLSSRMTFFYKVIFPSLWITGFGSGTWTMFQAPVSRLHRSVHGPAPEDLRWQFLAVWILGSCFILWISAPLKRVRVADGALLVSGLGSETRVAVQSVREVTQNRWLNVRPISVRLRGEVAGIGDRFTFLPPWRLRFAFWREDPEVGILRQLAGIRVAGD